MKDLIHTPNGYVKVSEIETFHVKYSPGYYDHLQVVVTLRSGREFPTRMFEDTFLRAYEHATGAGR